MVGTLALVGGAPFGAGCSFDAGLLEASGGSEVLVLPTGAAYEGPQEEIERAEAHFEALGARVRGLDVLARRDALDPTHAETVAGARFTYLVGGSPMHIRSVLKASPVWEALTASFAGGAVIAGSGGGAMVLCDPMVDPRGGAFTVGLGLIEGLTVATEFRDWSEDAAHRTRRMTPPTMVLAGIDEATALVRDPTGTWRAEGAGGVVLFTDDQPAGFDALDRVTITG